MNKRCTTWNIASATRPKDFPAFVEALKSAAAEHNELTLTGLLVVQGPGCNNYGLLLQGCEAPAARFVEQLTMALQPAKYSQIESDERLPAGTFTCDLGD